MLKKISVRPCGMTSSSLWTCNLVLVYLTPPKWVKWLYEYMYLTTCPSLSPFFVKIQNYWHFTLFSTFFISNVMICGFLVAISHPTKLFDISWKNGNANESVLRHLRHFCCRTLILSLSSLRTWSKNRYEPVLQIVANISVTNWCIVGYRTGELWDLCNRSLVRLVSSDKRSSSHILNKTHNTTDERWHLDNANKVSAWFV